MSLVHGVNVLSVEGNLLIIEGRGPWNLNSIDESVIEIPKEMKPLYDSAWGVLLIFKGDAILVPDAKQRLVEIVKKDIENGRKATALVLSECSTPQLITEHLSSIYEAAGDVFAEFKDITSAKQWLRDQIGR